MGYKAFPLISKVGKSFAWDDERKSAVIKTLVADRQRREEAFFARSSLFLAWFLSGNI